jgi:hypothetical protein
MLNPQLEQGAGLGIDGSNTRPADILVPVWSRGRSAAFDVIVVHPLNHDLVQGAGTLADQCLLAAEERKHSENDDKCDDLGWQCIPMVASAYGAWGKEATAALSRISWRIAVQEQQSAAKAKKDLFARLSMVQARSTARAILARSAPEVEPHDN